jgi:hypothetical protein
MMPARSNLTDRAKRYRAQSAVYGAHQCVLCGARGRLDVMHLDGNEANGDPRNLAYGCRSCNAKLAAAFKRIGAGVPTNQYNPSQGVPSFQQYAWAVTQGPGGSHHEYRRGSGWERGAEDEAGAIIHATPKSKRIEYARRIAAARNSHRNGGGMSKKNIWPFGAGQPLGSRTTHHRRTRPVSAKAAQREQRERESERLERKLSDRDLNTKLQRHYARGGTLAEFLQANPGLRPIAKLHREYEKLVHRIGSERNVKRLQSLIDQRDKVAKQLARLGFRVNPGKGSFARCVEAVSRRGDVDDPNAVCAASKRRTAKGARELERAARAGRKNLVDPTTAGLLGSELGKLADKLKKRATKHGNPAEAAAEMSERFHGRPVTEVLEIEERVHVHEHLAELGELERLKVKALDGGIVTLTGFDGALLCSNEDGSQLYIRGGDQSIDPSEFAVDKPYHDKEDLGEVVKIWYFTTKEHLGSEGGTASYHHEFGEEDKERGTRPRRPRLEYSTRDQRLSFTGGAYAVEPEGIRN